MGEAKRKKLLLDKRQTKPDTGIAILTNGFPMSEETRDNLKRRDWEAEAHTKKPADVNQMTTKELEDLRYSGFRQNRIANDLELWCVGRIASRRNQDEVDRNPSLVSTMHEEAFATNGSIIDMPLPRKR